MKAKGWANDARRQATIRQVAQLAGVSLSTASRILTGQREGAGDIGPRVRAAADQLGYRPNPVARALRSAQTATIAMVVPEIGNPFFPRLVGAVERALEATGRDLLLGDSQLDPAIEARRIQALVDRQVDGLVLIPLGEVESIAATDAASERCPVVLLDRNLRTERHPWVGVDDAVGIGLVLEHLAERGARTVTLVSAQHSTSSARQRHDAFVQGCGALGLVARPPLLGEFSTGWGRTAARRLGQRQPVDAVVCGNDEIAIGLLAELRLMGVHCPQDVLITGFDDTPFATLTDPSLTTVRQPSEEMAQMVLRLLGVDGAGHDGPPKADTVDGSGGQGAPAHWSVRPSLVVRDSTGRQGS